MKSLKQANDKKRQNTIFKQLNKSLDVRLKEYTKQLNLFKIALTNNPNDYTLFNRVNELEELIKETLIIIESK